MTGDTMHSIMPVLVIFILGIANFAMQRAVFESGHPLVERVQTGAAFPVRRLSMALEFSLLLAAMLLAANGWPWLAFVYAGYTSINALSAWAILTGRI